MNIQEKLKNLITKHKSNPNYDTIVNDLCRLYFEIEEQNYKENPFEGSQLKESKDDAITEDGLLDLGFFRKTSNKYANLVRAYITVWYDTQTKEVKIYNDKISKTITLDTLFFKISELRSFVDSIL